MNKIFKTIALLIIAFTYNNTLQSQSLLKYKDDGNDLSPSETRFNNYDFNTENRMFRTLFYNPAMEHIISSDSLFQTNERRNYVGVNYSAAALPHDFLILEGNDFNNYSLNAFGVINPKDFGTLYGSIEYARGMDKNIGWNAIRYYDIFSPFITTDSVGGDSSWEMYSLSGGYGFNINRWTLGAEFSYKGEQAYRLTDPRIINTTSWVNLDFGVSYRFSNSIMMFNSGYERMKQYQTERYWMPGLQERFFQTYGFGMYNDKYSRVSFGYSRMAYVQEFSLGAAYILDFDKDSRISASVRYYRSWLKTEESSIINLYKSKTNYFIPTIEYKIQKGGFNLLAMTEANIRLRTGYENIYDQVLIDPSNNIYDNRLISTRQNYNARNIEALLQIKPSYEFSTKHELSLVAGSYFFQREEEYKSKTHHLLNQWVEPHLGLGYELKASRSEFNFSMLLSKKITTDKIYKVNLTSTDEIEYLDFQHAFNPFAFYANNYNAFRINAAYIQDFKPFAVGLKAEFMLCDGNRLDDVIYDKTIGYNNSVQMVSKTPDAYIEKFGKITLFVMF